MTFTNSRGRTGLKLSEVDLITLNIKIQLF